MSDSSIGATMYLSVAYIVAAVPEAIYNAVSRRDRVMRGGGFCEWIRNSGYVIIGG